MDIEGAGWAVLSQLLERGLIHSSGRLLPADRRAISSRWNGSRARARENLRRPDRAGARRATVGARAQQPRDAAGRRADRDRSRHAGWPGGSARTTTRRPTARRARSVVRGGRGRAASHRDRGARDDHGGAGHRAHRWPPRSRRWFTDEATRDVLRELVEVGDRAGAAGRARRRGGERGPTRGQDASS